MTSIKKARIGISVIAGLLLLALELINYLFYNRVVNIWWITALLAVIAIFLPLNNPNPNWEFIKWYKFKVMFAVVFSVTAIVTSAVLFLIFKPNYTSDEAYKIINENPEIINIEIAGRNHSIINTKINFLIPQGYIFNGESVNGYIYVHFNPITGEYNTGKCLLRG